MPGVGRYKLGVEIEEELGVGMREELRVGREHSVAKFLTALPPTGHHQDKLKLLLSCK